MIQLLSLAVAFGAECDGPTAAYVDAILDQAPRSAYTCVARADDGAAELLARPAGDKAVRVSRALAMWRLGRLDGRIEAEELAVYNDMDRALLAEGIEAHRGKPVRNGLYVNVYQELGWYRPDPRYTPELLTERDRENLALLGRAVAGKTAADPSASACGCGPAAPVPFGLALAAAAAVAGRRRRGTVPGR